MNPAELEYEMNRHTEALAALQRDRSINLINNESFGLGFAVGLIGMGVVVWSAGLVKAPAASLSGATRRVLTAAAVVISAGTVGFAFLDALSWVDAFYCACITLTSVGYGDICPNSKSVEMQLFVVALALSGMGIFTGPFLDLMAAWKDHIRVSESSARYVLCALLFMLCVSVALFCTLEGWDVPEAMYFAVITGTTIGYGDHTGFKTDAGKLAAVLYALLSINVFGAITGVIGDRMTLAISGSTNSSFTPLLCMVAALVSLGTVGFAFLDSQPWVDAFFCACITLTSVGYGDICPNTKSAEMKLFVVLLALSGLGIFTGPFLDLMAAWKGQIHRRENTVAFVAIALLVMLCVSVALFCTLEGWDVPEAMYFAVITGTTIGYGDHLALKTDAGKLAAALFALLSVNVFGAITGTIGTWLCSPVSVTANLEKAQSDGKTKSD